MTGATETLEGRRIWVRPHAPEMQSSFGPDSVTRELYQEEVRPEQAARARSGTFWGAVGEKIKDAVINTAKKVGSDVLKGYPRAAARSGVYEVTPEGESIDDGVYRTLRAALTGKYPVEEADQTFLQRITGKAKQYVYGANWLGRLFVDRYLRGESEEQFYATVLHEAAHSAYPKVESEEAIEGVARQYALYLSRNDPSELVREKAHKAYRGFLDTGIETGGLKPAFA